MCIACVGDVVGAFGGREAVEELSDRCPQGLDGAGGGFAQQRLELGEEFLILSLSKDRSD